MKKKSVKMETITLVLLNGGTIEIVIPDDIAESFIDDFKAAQGHSSFWWAGNYDDVRATYKGICLDYINLSLVVGFV